MINGLLITVLPDFTFVMLVCSGLLSKGSAQSRNLPVMRNAFNNHGQGGAYYRFVGLGAVISKGENSRFTKFRPGKMKC